MEDLRAAIGGWVRGYSPADKIPAFVSRDVTIDFESRRLTVRGRDIHLTPKEFDVLKFLVANQGKPLTHRRLLQAVLGPDYSEETENLRGVLNQLRQQIESYPAPPKSILTE